MAASKSPDVLEDGRWLALAEDLAVPDAPGAVAGWIGGPGAWRAIAYQPAPGHAPVDAAALPGGGALVLERAFSLLGGFSARLCRLPAALLAAPAADAPLQPGGAPALPTAVAGDNYEGVATARIRGRTLVAVVSTTTRTGCSARCCCCSSSRPEPQRLRPRASRRRAPPPA
jgi:hypothetical protein